MTMFVERSRFCAEALLSVDSEKLVYEKSCWLLIPPKNEGVCYESYILGETHEQGDMIFKITELSLRFVCVCSLISLFQVYQMTSYNLCTYFKYYTIDNLVRDTIFLPLKLLKRCFWHPFYSEGLFVETDPY